MNDNIILIGMPGSGKSTLGVVLAKAIAYRFIDTDLLISEQSGKRLQALIDSEGNERFLRLENDIVKKLDTSRTVIATGGSVIYGKEAMEHLHSIGTVIYLSVGYDEIERRVSNFCARGIAMGNNSSLYDLYRERVELYEKEADITICYNGQGIEQTVMQIIERLGDKIK